MVSRNHRNKVIDFTGLTEEFTVENIINAMSRRGFIVTIHDGEFNRYFTATICEKNGNFICDGRSKEDRITSLCFAINKMVSRNK